MLSYILAEFCILGFRKVVIQIKKTSLNKKPFSAFEADMPDFLKTIQPHFSFCQADIFDQFWHTIRKSQLIPGF